LLGRGHWSWARGGGTNRESGYLGEREVLDKGTDTLTKEGRDLKGERMFGIAGDLGLDKETG